MTAPTLVVSNPPHGEVDRRRAARCFGLSPAEALMKANFPAPEIWMADSEAANMQTVARELHAAGLNTMVIPGTELAGIPVPEVVESVQRTEPGYVLRTGDIAVELAVEDRFIAVYCKPPPQEAPKARRSASLADSIGRSGGAAFIHGLVGRGVSEPIAEVERATFLDVYVGSRDGGRRLSVVQDLTDIAGLGPGDGSVHALVEDLARGPEARVDRRLEGIRPRLRPMVGRPVPHAEDRKLFSYGTQALSHLLESISSELRNVAQYELGSRLAYAIAASEG